MKNQRMFVGVVMASILVISGCTTPWTVTEIRETPEVPPAVIKTVAQQPVPALQPDKPIKDQLRAWAEQLQFVDAENFSFSGCALVHGVDSSMGTWNTMTDDKLNAVYNFYAGVPGQSQLVRLSFANNRNGVSDEVWVVTCNCTDYEAIMAKVDETKLLFNDLVYHKSLGLQLESDKAMMACVEKGRTE